MCWYSRELAETPRAGDHRVYKYPSRPIDSALKDNGGPRNPAQNRSPTCPCGRGIGRGVRNSIPGELPGHPAARPGTAVPRTITDLHGDAGARAVPEPSRPRQPEIRERCRVHGLCQSRDALAAGGHGARAAGAEALGGPDAAHSGRRRARSRWHSGTTDRAGRCARRGSARRIRDSCTWRNCAWSWACRSTRLPMRSVSPNPP